MTRSSVSRVPDAELLGRFVRHRDEAAFELLVWRYQRLVHGVCRRTVGDRHAAEDAAQATFLLLARRADRLRDGAALPGWLARVAYRCGVKARKVSRERERPVEVFPPVAHAPGSPDQLELFAALDAELDRLPDRFRLPVVLCHLDGRTYADAATALGIPVGTLSGRLTRARQLLKDRLTRRGLAPLAVPVVVAADPTRVAAVTRAALAFAAGGPATDPSAFIALGVLRAMTLPKLVAASVAAFVGFGIVAAGLAVADPPPKPPVATPAARPVADAARLQGEWLFESATDERGNDALRQYWNARLVFRKTTVAVSGSPYSEAAVETTFALDPTASPKRMDWAVPAFYQTILKLPAGDVRGIYKLDGDTLTVCMANKPGGGPRQSNVKGGDKPTAGVIPFGPRPTEFKTDADKGHFLFTVKRWIGKPGEKLTEGKVTVLDPDGKPAAGATILGVPQRWHDDGLKRPEPILAGADGAVRFPAESGPYTLTARLPGRGLIGYVDTTPAGFHHGLSVRLVPQASITGKLAVDPPPAAGGIGSTNVYLKRPGNGGRFLAGYADLGGRFEFVAPPGDYELYAYGDVFAKKTVPLTVPPGVAAVDAGTVTSGLTKWGMVVGRPAPELPGLAGWVGSPTPVAGLKGKVGLLWFMGGSQDPLGWAVADVVTAHDKYAGRGLAVVGVSLDSTGAVATAAVLRERVKHDLPFPVALGVGVADDAGRTPAAAAYGIEHTPTGVLIDRRGVVRAMFHPDHKPSVATLEKLLAE